MIQYAQGDNTGKKDADRAHLLKNKGNVEQEKLDDQAHGFSFFMKIVDFFKKIDQHIDSYEASHQAW